MNERILQLLKYKSTLLLSDEAILKQAIDKFPYMQALRVLYLKLLHDFFPDQYKSELSRTAVYTTDKKILFQLINPINKEVTPSENDKKEPISSLDTTTDTLPETEEKELISAIQIEEPTEEKVEEKKETPTNVPWHVSTQLTPKSLEQKKAESTQQKTDTNKQISIAKPTVEIKPEIEQQEQTIASTPRVGWRPMQFKGATPDALLQNKQIPAINNDKPISKQTPAQEVSQQKSSFAIAREREKTPEKKEIEEPKKEPIPTSNVNDFIGTWQKWLQKSVTPSERKPEKTLEKNSKIIDQFIETNPRIKALKQDVNYEVKQANRDISHLMTETLANLYREQKNTEKAISAYQILQKKHPERQERYQQIIQEIKASASV